MHKRAKLILVLFLIGILAIPALSAAATTFRVDMDANTAGLQTEIWATAGQTFTSNIEIVMDSPADSLSIYGFSLWWDMNELSTPLAGDITTSPLASGWSDLSYDVISAPYIYSFAQNNFSGSTGALTGTVATINWTAANPVTDGGLDIMLGLFEPRGVDVVYDGYLSEITPTFEGGTVNIAVVPEPMSFVLFAIGATVIGIRRFKMKR